ncbi:MAG: glycine betaine ABC transporter substrate-binding protein [Planctomycetota bacterium JB042]
MSGRRPAAAALLVLSIAAGSAGANESIAIGSKNFTENRLLAEIMAQLVEAETDLEVERRTNLGGTMVVFEALRQGEIDLYPDYTGTGWAIVLKEEERVTDPLRVYLRVRNEYERRFQIEWLDPFGFANSYAVAMREDVAERLGVTRVSELADVDETLVAALSHEFLNREDGWPGLSAWYGLDEVEVRGMEHGLAFEAIRSSSADLIDAWTTDGKLLKFDVRILADDRRFFPPYDCAPLARAETLARHPELRPVLDRLAFRIDDARMMALNHEVEVEGRAFEAVARDFLRAEGLLSSEGGGDERPEIRRDVGFLRLFWSRRTETLRLALEHLLLSGLAVALAILIAVPLGIALSRRERLAGVVLGAAGVIQTVPSLALLAFMIPLLGIGVPAALAALFLYSLLPIVRNTWTAIREVDDELVEAARGMGLTDRQILRLVELPLATRTIMAGVRTAAVIAIGIATLAAFISAGGLGEPIVTGLQLNDPNLILCGAVPAALLAVAVDLALARAEEWMAPKT